MPEITNKSEELEIDYIVDNLIAKPFGPFKNWGACMTHMQKPKGKGGGGYSKERAEKVCGRMKQRLEKGLTEPLVTEDMVIYKTPISLEMPFKIEKRFDEPRIIAGYASIEVVDKQDEKIPIPVLAKAWEKFIGNPDFAYSSILHSNIPVGKMLKEYTDSEGEYYKAGVDENGLFVIVKIRDDIKVADRVWELINADPPQLKAFSIGGEALSKTPVFNGEPFTQINELELHEVAVVDIGANPSSFKILKGASKLLVGPVHRGDDLNSQRESGDDSPAGIEKTSRNQTKGELNMSEKQNKETKEVKKEETEAIIPDTNTKIEAILQKILDRLPEKVEKSEEKTNEKSTETEEKVEKKEKDENKEKSEKKEVKKEDEKVEEKEPEPEKDETMTKWTEMVSKKLEISSPAELELSFDEVAKELVEVAKKRKKELPCALKKFLVEQTKTESEEDTSQETLIDKAVKDEINKRFGEVETTKRSKVIKEDAEVKKSVTDLTLADYSQMSWKQVEKLAETGEIA